MKKIFYFLTAAALTLAVNACSDALAPAEQSTLPKEAGSIGIVISNVTDYSFDVTLTPKGTPAYYAYLVDNDEPDEGIDAASLYAVKYASVAQGNVKYQKGSETFTFTVDAEPNTLYTVYAVSSSNEGNVGEVAYKTVLTSDEGDPVLKAYDFEENVFYLQFSEEVSYVEGKEVVAVGYPSLYLTGEPVVASSVGKVEVDGKVAKITFEEFEIPGTYYTVSYPGGTFVDACENPCEAVESRFIAELPDEDEEDPDPIINEEGLYGYLENAAFDFKDIPEAVLDYAAYTEFTVPQNIEDIEDKALTIAITSGNITTTYEKVAMPTYKATGENTIGFKLPVEPERGDKLVITIPEKTVMDIFGNVNNECVISGVYSYGYKLEDIYGTYQNAGASGFGPTYDEDPWTFTIAASDDAEKGNIMVTEWYGFDEDVKIYASFDTDLGKMTMPIYYQEIGGFMTYLDAEMIQIGVVFYYTFAYYSCGMKQKNDLNLYMTELGKFTKGNDYPGYYYEVYQLPASGKVEDIDEDKDYLGADYNIFKPQFEKVEAAGGEEPGEGGSSFKPLNGSYKFYHQPKHNISFDKIPVFGK